MGGKKTTAAKQVTENLEKIRAAAFKNPDHFVQTQLIVKDKVADRHRFKYNWPQQQMAKTIRVAEMSGELVRFFFLKSRQVGTSTMMAARNFTRCWAKNDIECVLVAHFEDRASELLERVKFFHETLDPRLQLTLSHDSKFGIQFAIINSKMTIVSSRNIEAVKGGTKQYGHITEFPHMKKPMHVLEEVSLPIARRPGTGIIIETTGYGYDSDAHKFYKSCRAGKEIFKAEFLRWQDDPTCVWGEGKTERELDYEIARAFEYEKRLRERQEQHRLNKYQILHGYHELKDQLYGNWDKYLQEYPCDEDEAWRTAEGSWFGAEVVNILLRMATNLDADADFYSIEGWPLSQMFERFEDLAPMDPVQSENENTRPAYVKVWRYPTSYADYLVISDSAGGEQDGNFSSTWVINTHTLEMVAEFNGRVRPDEHAYLAASLSSIYNGAMCVPEVNNHGHAMLQVLKGICPNIYRMKDLTDNKHKPRNRLGWVTDQRSRNLALATFRQIAEDIARGRLENCGIIRSRALVKEMMTFVERESGKPEAAPGCADDRVMALAIGHQVAIQETLGGERDVLKHLYGAAMDGAGSQKSNLIYTPRQDPGDVIAKIEDEILGGYGFNGFFIHNGGGGNEHGW